MRLACMNCKFSLACCSALVSDYANRSYVDIHRIVYSAFMLPAVRAAYPLPVFLVCRAFHHRAQMRSFMMSEVKLSP